MEIRGRIRSIALGLAAAMLLLWSLALLASCTSSAPVSSAPASSTSVEPAPKASAPKAAKPIKVSIGIDQTGPSSGTALHLFRGAEHFFRWTNDQGGAGGAHLDVMWADTQYKVPLDVEYYKRARDQGSVLHITSSTATGIALAELAAEDKMPVISISGDNQFMMPPRTIFSSSTPFAYQVGTELKWFLDNWKESRAPRVAWVGWDHPAIKNAGVLVEPWLKDKLARSDGLKYQWVGTVLTALRAPDYSTYLLKVKELKADVVVLGMDSVDSGALARDAQRLGLFKETSWVLLHSGVFGVDTTKIAGVEAVEGWIYPTPFDGTSDGLPGLAKIKEAQNKYQGFLYDDPNYVTGWVTAAIAVEAIKQAAKGNGVASVDRTAVLEAMYRLKGLDTGGITGAISLSKDKVYALDAIKISRIREGKPVPVSDWIKAPRFVDGL